MHLLSKEERGEESCARQDTPYYDLQRLLISDLFALQSDDGIEMVDNKLFENFCEEFLLGCRPSKEKREA